MNWIHTFHASDWVPPALPENGEIPHGDMPGDRVEIGETHIQKANVIFPVLCEEIRKLAQKKIVVAVSGGSGVGKSETASLLSYYFNALGVGAYTLSGDNYPRRIPAQNDAERERIYRVGGVQGLLSAACYSDDVASALQSLWETGTDADSAACEAHPWLSVYQKAGREALSGYLGTDLEQNYAELSEILARFKAGADKLWLKRMGRTPDALWYEEIDFSEIDVLILEWTHGNSANLHGVDIPILLNSTPEETAAHRRSRARDGKTDSPFTTTVLQIEQGMLHRRADAAKIIVSKAGELLTHAEYHQRMGD